MTSLHYNLIVIGAGPAGSMAAAEAASRGFKVLLLEKRELPRHKTCGGGMPMVVSQHIRDLSPEAFVESDVKFMRHSFKFDDIYLGDMNPDGQGQTYSLWMVQRSIFDRALAMRAVDAGAELIDEATVRKLEFLPDRLELAVDTHASTQNYTADFVIGADGANGISAKAANLRQTRTLAIAIEVEQPYNWDDNHPIIKPDICHLEYGAVPQGYAWVFPKADHLNVGAGVFRPRRKGRGDAAVAKELRQAIADYLAFLSVPFDADAAVYRAHPLPIWDGKEVLQSKCNRLLLAGDAAGLINPFFGDGILHAIKSGEMAGKAVAEGTTASHTEAIHAEFAANFDGALMLAKFFYQFPGVCYKAAVKRETSTRSAVKLLAGETMFNDISGRVLRKLRSALKSGSRL